MAMDVLASIGRAQLRVVGLNPQRLTTESESRFPGAATWNGMDYQRTGKGEKSYRIEAVTAPHIFGGMDALDWLRRQHEASEPVDYIRMGSNFSATRVGLVGIRHLFVGERKLHPLDGIGRIVEVEIDMVHLRDPV